MSQPAYRPLPEGIYTPIPTFFQPNEDLDIPAFATQVRHVAAAGTTPVVLGSAGEAPHVTAQERILLIRTARDALDQAGLGGVPLVAGVGAPSTRETVQFAIEAAEAGADYAMVLPPGYYAGQLAGRGSEALRRYLVDVAEGSPLPVVLYNFPSVSGGIDLDSDMILDVARGSSNVVGVKLTWVDAAFLSPLTSFSGIVGYGLV